MYATIMTIVAILAIICCLVEGWLLIEASRELDRREEGHREDRSHATRLLSDSTLELEQENSVLKEKNESLLERLAEMEGWLEGIEEPEFCQICEREEACPLHMNHPYMVQCRDEMKKQHEEDMKAEEARLASYVCDQCGKRGGCYCNGLTSDEEVVPF